MTYLDAAAGRPQAATASAAELDLTYKKVF